MVVRQSTQLNSTLISYSVHLAERLDYDLLVVYVDRTDSGDSFQQSAARSAERFGKAIAGSGIGFQHVVRVGATGPVIEEIIHQFRRIEMVVIDETIQENEITEKIVLPVFQVLEPETPILPKGEKRMEQQSSKNKSGLLWKTCGLGLTSVGLYGAIFLNTNTIMTHFTRGGWYAAMPIATVFVFSFVHGAFASNLWSLLGIDAKKKTALQHSITETVKQQKKVRIKPRARAYINPFHRV
jgi:hypothetical protein